MIKKEMFTLNGLGSKFSLLKKEKEQEKTPLTLQEHKALLEKEEENIDILSTEIEDKVHKLEEIAKETQQKKNEFLEAERILKEKKAALKEAEKMEKQAEKEIKQMTAEKNSRILKHAVSCKEYQERDEKMEKIKESIRGGVPIDETRLTKEIVDKMHMIHAFEKQTEDKSIQADSDKLTYKLTLIHGTFSSTYLIETPLNYEEKVEIYRFSLNKSFNKIELIGSGQEHEINWNMDLVSEKEAKELNLMIVRELYILHQQHAEKQAIETM